MPENDQHQFKDRYMLRLPDGMRDRIKTVAAQNNRSMNAEIVAALEEAFPAPEDPFEDVMASWIEGYRDADPKDRPGILAEFIARVVAVTDGSITVDQMLEGLKHADLNNPKFPIKVVVDEAKD
jgi:plasmid stability protein